MNGWSKQRLLWLMWSHSALDNQNHVLSAFPILSSLASLITLHTPFTAKIALLLSFPFLANAVISSLWYHSTYGLQIYAQVCHISTQPIKVLFIYKNVNHWLFRPRQVQYNNEVITWASKMSLIYWEKRKALSKIDKLPFTCLDKIDFQLKDFIEVSQIERERCNCSLYVCMHVWRKKRSTKKPQSAL